MHCRAVDISRDTLIGASSAAGDVDLEIGFEEDVVAPMLVHQRRARLARLAHVVDGGQLLQIERHCRCDVLGFGARRRHAHRDEFADLAHLAGGEHRLLGNLEARQPRDGADRIDAGKVRRGEDAAAIALRDVYAADQRMRQRTAHEGNVLHAGETNVGDELAAAAHQPVVFLARQPRADALSGARTCGRKLALVAHGDVLPDRTDADLLCRNGLRQNRRHRVVTRTGAQAERRLQQTLGDDFVLLVVAEDEPAGLVLRSPRRRPPCRP